MRKQTWGLGARRPRRPVSTVTSEATPANNAQTPTNISHRDLNQVFRFGHFVGKLVVNCKWLLLSPAALITLLLVQAAHTWHFTS